jgi:hypothetical protein
MIGQGTATYFGISASTAGDVNNDNYDDVIIGAYAYNSSTGRAYIYYGGSPMDSTADAVLTGQATNNLFGVSASNAGDVNNDNYDDVIVGAQGFNSNTGRAYIYYGDSSMDTTADAIMTGQGTNNYFGCSVSGAGNVNNDNFSDVIVGAYRYNNYTGRAYIYYGGSSMDTTADVIITGAGINYDLGSTVSNAGNVNNDDYDDVIVGAYHYNNYTGRAYIYYGGSSMDTTADVTMTGEGTYSYFGRVSDAGNVNNDNYDDVMVGAYGYNSNTGRVYIYYGGSSMDSTVDIILTGEGTSDYFGMSVSGAGDVNNDNYDDIIIGAFGYPLNGKAYIYSDPSSPVSVKTSISFNPNEFELLQNYPNPFNPSTTILFSVGTYGHTSLRIYDVLGREVAILINETKPAGSYQVTWNATDLPSGIYFSSLESGGKKLSRKLLLIK